MRGNVKLRKIENASVGDFITENHLQGFRKANVCYGLFKDGELLQIMSFAHHEKYQWEIIRGCLGSNNLVVGECQNCLIILLKNTIQILYLVIVTLINLTVSPMRQSVWNL